MTNNQTEALMGFLYDFFPIIVFFIVYKLYGVFAATATAIMVSFFQMILFRLTHKHFHRMHVITTALIAVFGGLTLILHNPLFIQWKISIINWLFAAVFVGSQFIGEKPIIARLLSDKVTLPSHIWHRLNLMWAGFLTLIGIINVFVIYYCSMDAWVNFKLFGVLGLTIAFVFIQAIYLSRHMTEPKEEEQP